MIVVGTAHRMPVAIGGMALAGVGAGIALPIGIAGIVELVPVNQRGLYLGTVYLVFTCVAASPAYGVYSIVSFLICSHDVFCQFDVAVGRLDSDHHCRSRVFYPLVFLSPSAETDFNRLDET